MNQVKQRVILLKKIIQKVFFLIRMFVIFYGGEKVDLVRFIVKTEIDQERGGVCLYAMDHKSNLGNRTPRN